MLLGVRVSTVSVKLFAGLQGLVGKPVVELALPSGATVGQLRDKIVEEYPVLEAFIGTLVCAVNEEMVPVDHVLADDEKVELIPPIAGG
jgi:molybdopterin synthase sulfur carrier subunit